MNIKFLILAAGLFALIASTAEAQSQPKNSTKANSPPPARVPEGVKVHRDLEYVTNGHARHKLDVFVPENASGPLPLIIWVHGGGWQNGSKDGCPPLHNGYTERGYAVASINYRLSAHAVFPAQIEDCKAAIRWLRAHAKEYNLDPQRFGVWGSSAGGHLVAVLGTSGDVKKFDVGANLDQSSRVQAVCDYYGPTDFTVFVTTPGYESHARAEAPEGKLIGGAVMESKAKAALANPITFVSRDDPPFLIVHGDKDTTVPINQSQLLFAALKKTGVSTHFHKIKGAGHGQGFGGPEIAPLVEEFFERTLKSKSSSPQPVLAKTSESVASGGPAQPPTQSPSRPAQPTAAGGQRGPGLSFDQILSRGDTNKDGKLSRDEFRGPPPLFDRLDANKDGFVTREEHERAFPARPAPPASTPKAAPQGAMLPTGLLYFASYRERDNPAPVTNPHLLGALFTTYWSDVEKTEGVFDWSALDRRIALWTDAGKKVALRIMWSSSGNWPEPAAKHPTPQFVLDAGAVTVHSESSKTDVPLFWDPIYRRHANRFLAEVARKFDGDPNVLFLDVTPGAETNPYRFRRINAAEPRFKTLFAEKAASDGHKYSHELWLETVKQAIDDASAAFKRTPLLVTLNAGSLDGPEQFRAIGDHAVSRGCYVGQNGLNARSYNEESPRKTAFTEWSAKTKFYFEMVDATGGGTRSLMDVMKAAERVGCNYLGVYAVDVLRGTRGQANFDPHYEAALAYGAKVMGQTTVAAVAETLAPAKPQAVAKTAEPKKGPAPAGRARDTEPNWLMPPVAGANLHYKTFESKIVGQKVSYLLYLPPGYETSQDKRYPVVYWLHGIGGSQQGVPGMTARLTSAIADGRTPPFLMVFVNGMIRSSYVDSADGKTPVESVAIKELIPHMDATYRTVATRAGRMIEGFSMGGGGAAKWGFKHPELFGAISIIDGALHKPSDATSGRLADSFQTIYSSNRTYFEASNPWNLAEKNAAAVRGRTPVRIVTRTTGLGGLNQEFSELLTRLGVTNEFHAIPDAPHSPNPLYEGLGDANWTFYRKAFAAVIVSGSGAIAPQTRPAVATAPAIVPALTATQAAVAPNGFQLADERWTYRDGDFEMNGILLKPEGKGPFPALLISHGLGGTAENFGLNKAREMVKWGVVCIAPDYTHSAKFLSGQRGGAPKGGAPKSASKGGAPSAKKGGGQIPANVGASEENVRRARTCIELVGKMPEVDAKRVAAYGHSMGGFVTIGLAASSTKLIRAAAISGSGVAPQEGFPAPSAKTAEKIRTPFLMLHGSADNTVRPSQSESLKEVLDRDQVPNARHVFQGEGHPIDQSKREEVFKLIREWFTRYGVLP